MTGLGPSPLRLCAFAGDIPGLTGARSAPYETFFASFAFFAAILLFVGCGSAALGTHAVIENALWQVKASVINSLS